MSDSDTKPPVEDDGDRAVEFNPPEDGDITVIWSGGPLRSFLATITDGLKIDEAKLRIDSDGLHVTAVDPANVGLIQVTAPASGMSGFHGDAPDTGSDGETDGHVIGLPITRKPGLQEALSYARKGRGKSNGDPVRIDFYFDAPDRIRVATIRPDQGVKRVTEFFGINPDSLRSEPEIPDLDLAYRADPDPSTLSDAIDAINYGDHIRLTGDGRDFVIENSDTDDADDSVRVGGAAWSVSDPDGMIDPNADGSLYSEDYLTDFVEGIDSADANTLTAKWGDEFPIKLSWSDTGTGINGMYMLAPRIQSD